MRHEQLSINEATITDLTVDSVATTSAMTAATVTASTSVTTPDITVTDTATIDNVIAEDTLIRITDKGAPAAGATGTLTAAMLIGGVIDGDSEAAGGATWTTDTAANIIAAIPDAKVGSTFQTVVMNNNTGASAEVITLAGGTDVTMRGVTLTLTEGTNETALLIFRMTGAAAMDCYVITNA